MNGTRPALRTDKIGHEEQDACMHELCDERGHLARGTTSRGNVP